MLHEDKDCISAPPYYCEGRNYQPKDVIKDWNLNFNLGNVIKYLSRAGRKEGNSVLQDLAKARQYLDFELEYLEQKDKPKVCYDDLELKENCISRVFVRDNEEAKACVDASAEKTSFYNLVETHMVKREVSVLTGEFQIGDHIRIGIGGKPYWATAIQQEEDGMLFLFDDCLDECQPINKNGGTRGGYKGSDLKVFFENLEDSIDVGIKKYLKPFENGDIFRLLTLREVCGRNNCFLKLGDVGGQIEWMEDIRHRISFRDGEMENYWLQDAISDMHFALITRYGDESYGYASNPYGIRPAFKIRNPWV